MKIIERTHEEYMTEIRQFFDELKPLLDNGTSFSKAVRIIRESDTYPCYNRGWFKTLKEYAEQQGYVSQPVHRRCQTCKYLIEFFDFSLYCKFHDLDIKSLKCTCKWWCE